jgi:UDP-glucuronate 4-epimerase
MRKTILVTGAAGFIGSHTVDALVARGDTVVGLDSFNDYYEPAQKRANLADCVAGERFRLVEGDIRDRAKLADLFATTSFDAVVHLAAMAGVRASADDPHLYYDVNLNGTLNLLEEARRCQLMQFVLASTSSVYGRTERIPFVEDDPCDRPLAPYPASKRAAEMLGHVYHHLYGLPITALRFFTVYGPRGRPDMMALKLLDSIADGKKVPLYNGGDLKRDWTYVADIVDGVLAAVDTPLGFEVLNLGRGQPVLLSQFVAEVERSAGGKAALHDEPMPDADVPITFANIDKASRLLGYRPKTSITSGIDALVRWHQREARA